TKRTKIVFVHFAISGRTLRLKRLAAKVAKNSPRAQRRASTMAPQTTTLPVHAAPLTGVSLPAFTLWWREVVRFYRQRTSVVVVIATPVVFWLVIGSGFGSSFR